MKCGGAISRFHTSSSDIHELRLTALWGDDTQLCLALAHTKSRDFASFLAKVAGGINGAGCWGKSM